MRISDCESALAPAPLPKSLAAAPARVGLLLSRDLIFTTKVKETARALGYHLVVASDAISACSAIETSRPCGVFIDLTAGELAAKAAIIGYRQLAGAETWFVAFGPHVNREALAVAEAAGCHLVIPRSKFAAELPALLHRCYRELPADRVRRSATPRE